MRIVGKKPIDIREQDQKIRPDQRSHDCRERVVVAKLHLISRNRIIFIHNRDCAKTEQFVERILRILSRDRVHHRVLRHQHLPCHLIVFRKKPLIDHHQSRLTDRCACLLCRNVLRPLIHAERLSAHGNRAGAYQAHIHPAVPQIAEFSYQMLQLGKIQIARLPVIQ